MRRPPSSDKLPTLLRHKWLDNRETIWTIYRYSEKELTSKGTPHAEASYPLEVQSKKEREDGIDRIVLPRWPVGTARVPSAVALLQTKS